MRKVFVYGILQQSCLAKDFDILPSYVIDEKAKLYGYKRISLSYIEKSGDERDFVRGEIIEIPEELEEKINEFESQFGYKRKRVKVCLNDGSKCDAIAYLRI